MAAALFGLAAMTAGCTAGDGIGVSTRADQSLSSGAIGTTGSTPATAQQSVRTSSAASVSAARIRIAPVIGASASVLPSLSEHLAAHAGQNGLTIIQAESSATHTLRGYFSTITDNGRTTVIYVWDVLDPAGNRLHRIQGTQVATGGDGEGWAAVTPSVMETIANRTIDELVSWLAGSPAVADAS